MALTRKGWLRDARIRLSAAGIEEAELEARFLIQETLGLSATDLVTQGEALVSDSEAELLEARLARRESREPLSQVLGSQPFWTLTLGVTRDVLTPRADTETLVHAALDAVADRHAPLRLLDIGTGSGAILLALLSELPNATGVGTDISAQALHVAKANAASCGLEARVQFVNTSWADDVDGKFDLVLSNPPYIASSVLAGLEPEVRDHEPHLALDGGQGGLRPYPHLLREVHRLLRPEGRFAFEIGHDQGAESLRLAAEAGVTGCQLRRDLGGRDRCLIGQLRPSG